MPNVTLEVLRKYLYLWFLGDLCPLLKTFTRQIILDGVCLSWRLKSSLAIWARWERFCFLRTQPPKCRQPWERLEGNPNCFIIGLVGDVWVSLSASEGSAHMLFTEKFHPLQRDEVVLRVKWNVIPSEMKCLGEGKGGWQGWQSWQSWADSRLA